MSDLVPPPAASPEPAPRRPLLVALVGPAAVASVLVVMALLVAEPWVAVHQPREAILHAIRMVESGGRDGVPDGDDGRAVGPYQIHRRYWQDAVAFEPVLDGNWSDCRDRDYAEAVIDAYMRRWAKHAWASGHAQVIARVHNGGPEGMQKSSTRRYWRRVRAVLAQPRPP